MQKLWRHKIRLRRFSQYPRENFGRGSRLCFPSQALSCIDHALLSQLLKELLIGRKFTQYLFHLGDNVTLTCKSYLVTNILVNNVSRTAEVSHHGYGTRCKSLKYHTCTIITKSWKDKHICGAHPLQHVRVVKPATEGNSLLDSQGDRQLFQAGSLRTVAYYRKSCRVASQYWRRSTQCQITSLSGDQSADKEQFKLGRTFTRP